MEFSREQATVVTGSLLVLAAVALAAALSYTASAMIPLVLSFMVSYLVGPFVDTMQVRLRLPRGVAIFAALIAMGAGAALLTSLLLSSMASLGDNTQQYEQHLRRLVEDTTQQVELWAPGLVPPGWQERLSQIDADQLRPLLSTVRSAASGLLQALSQLLGNATLVTVMSVYLVSGRAPRQVRGGLLGEIESQIRIYLGTKFLTSATTGILTGLILSALGLDLALVFGFLAFLLNFVPTFGSVVATLLPLPLAMLDLADTPWKIVAAIVLPGMCQFTIGNVVEPKIMGDNLKLHPITVLANLVFWGILWGPVGMLLATPIAAVLRIVLERFDTTRPIAWVLGGRIDQLEQAWDDPPAVLNDPIETSPDTP